MKIRGKPRAGSIFLFVLLSAVLLLQAFAVAGYQTVSSVEFTGNKRTSAETIRATIKMHAGSPLDIRAVDDDIRALYALGQFRDIRVESQPSSGGVKLTYVLEEKPFIAEIGFDGNRKIKSEDLRAEITQQAFSTLNERQMAESIEKIKALYAKKGYYLVSINHHVETTDQGETKLIFDVKENQEVIVRKILFIGNKVFKDDALRNVIKTRQKGFLSFLTSSGKYHEEMLRNDSLMLTYHYLNSGYLKVKVSPPKVTISKDKRYLFVTFEIHEGSQYKIGKVTLDGDILTTHEELVSLLKTKKGDIYSQKTLDGDMAMLQDRYGDEGYAYAGIIPQTIPDDEALTADVNIQISKGKRIYIERINIEGNTTTRDKVIRREMLLKENDRYSERKLNQSRENLMKLGFFEDVSFATPRGTRDDTMVLNISVKEKPTGSFNISAGFSTFEQFIFNASVQKENFFGYGIGGSISAEVSKKRQLFTLSLNDPYFLDSSWSVGGSVYKTAFSYTDFRRESLGGDINLGHRFFDNFSASVGYQIEQVKASDFSYAVPQLFRIDNSGLTSALSLTIARDTRDNRITPRKGMFNVLDQGVSGSKLGGNNDYYRVGFKTMFYQPIWKTIIFQEFFRIGYVKSLNKSPVPLYERYFLGGPNNLRGYNFNTIGPTLRIAQTPAGPIENFVYGGDKVLLFLTEVELPIYDKAGVRAVGFFDAGNSFAENENYDINRLRLDYGFGLRWNSPMGPLRFEWGFPIERQSGEDSVVFNFTIGNVF